MCDTQRFAWTDFYVAVAEKLLDYRDDRKPLIEGIRKIAARVPALSYLLADYFADGSKGPLADICPFTALGTFNRGTTDENRKVIAMEIANLIDVNVPVPESFEGLPVLNNQKSWFFSYEKDREDKDIDRLWNVFAVARRFVKSDQAKFRAEFAEAYDDATKVRGVAWNLSMGLYWAHPWDFLTLDSRAREYMTKHLAIPIPTSGGQPCDAENYLELLDGLKAQFKEESYPVHSFPEFSREAWNYTQEPDKPEVPGPEPSFVSPEPVPSYTIDHAVADLFLGREKIEGLSKQLRRKKNLVLQGPPGTGKTYIAQRLAWLLVGEQSRERIKVVQFHQSYGYEDFVRGYRPTRDGGFDLQDGPFLEVCERVRKEDRSHVLVIDEINRGNLSRIFGELLLLIEADKRSAEWAVRIPYARPDEPEEIYVPPKLYLIGTMNTADRSLALVDYALRRRFAFSRVDPAFSSDRFARYLDKHGVPEPIRHRIIERLKELNVQIEKDPQLGREFRIGHSYFCRPPKDSTSDDAWTDWYTDVIRFEIGPLLREYWFDETDRANKAEEKLLAVD